MPSRAPASATSRSGSASGRTPRGPGVNDERAHDALALAERALAFAEAAGATEAEALVMAEDAALTRFANSQIHQNVAETNVAVNLRFVIGKRVGVASQRPDRRRGPAPPGRAARRPSPASSRSSTDWGGLPDPTPVEPVAAAYAPATADGLAGAAGRRRPRRSSPRPTTAGVTAYGSFSTGTETIAVANSKGIRAGGTRTVAQLLTVSMGPGGGTGYAEQAAVDATTIDAAAIGRQASQTRPGPRPTPWPSRPATTRSCSTSTPSSTCSTCSATSASRPWPSRRSARSSRSAGASAASS